MQLTKPVGRNASAMKYDILSALGVFALSGDKYRQRLCLRLIVLITARYNWQRDELSIGRAEIARLWSVDERTVKREMGKLKAMGWLSVKHPGARGRVTVYGLEIGAIGSELSETNLRLGPDFVQRVRFGDLTDHPEAADAKVVPLRRPLRGTGVDQGIWGLTRHDLASLHPSEFKAWLAGLGFGGFQDGTLTLIAPSKFVASYVRTHFERHIVETAQKHEPAVRHLVIGTTN